MTALTGSPNPVQLRPGVTITAPGVVGTADLAPGAPVDGTTRGPEESTREFLEALAQNDFQQQHQVLVSITRLAPGGAGGTRTADGTPGITLTVPAAGPDEAQVLLVVDEAGIASWQLPDGQPEGVPPTRGGAPVSFTIEREVATPPQDADPSGQRGIVTAIGKKLLSVFLVPVLERAAGAAAVAVARRYEDSQRPQGVLRLTDTSWTPPGAHTFAAGAPDPAAPALLFVHGTASSTTAAFSALDAAAAGETSTLSRLRGAYADQVYAFDHHSLSASLDDNVDTFLKAWPSGPGVVRRQVDLVTHSRGGLVARALAAALADPSSPLEVRRIVYVCTPNGGTDLADPRNIRAYVNRMTTMLNLLPEGPWSVVTEVLSGVLTAVRVLVSGAVGTLPGLTCMDPRGDVVGSLALPPPTVEQYAIDVEFEPTGRLLSWVRGADALVDKVFGDVANDMVVPTGGVGALPSREWKLPVDRQLSLGARSDTWHCSVFRADEAHQDPVHRALEAWLRA